MCKSLNELKGALSLIAKFDTEEDDNTIDNLICFAINNGYDINLDNIDSSFDFYQDSYSLFE